jgi:WD40 repeat protein
MSDGGASTGRYLVFVSYAHEDAKWLDVLRIWLKPYLRAGKLVVWADPYLRAGDDWRREIDDALTKTCVGVLLLSFQFAASDFIAEKELPALCALAEERHVRLFPVPVSAVSREWLKLSGLDRYQWAWPVDEPLEALSEAERNRAMATLTDKLVGLLTPELDTVTVELEQRLRAASVTASMMRLSSSNAPSAVPQPSPPKPVGTRDTMLDRPAVAGALHGVPELPPNFVTRPRDFSELEAALIDGTTSRHGISARPRAGVHGQGGIGKTVLAISLARDDDVRRAFPDGIFWLTFGQEPNLSALQTELWTMAKGEPREFVSPNLGQVALREIFERKRCLLVLDDIWQSAHTTPFEILGDQGRLLITTRDREILAALGADTRDLDVLDAASARNLLARWANVSANELPFAANEVAKQCGYLPLALSLAGAQVAGGTPWNDLLTALKQGDLEFLNHANRSVFKALSLSLRALPEREAARCHELGVIPEDTAAPESVVLKLWGESTLDAIHGRQLLLRFKNKALLSLAGEAPNREVRLHDLQGDYLRLVAGDLSAAHGRLLDAHARDLPDTETPAVRWALLPASETYLWRHLFHHLLGADRADEAAKLARDPRWLAAKLKASGVPALLADLTLLVERAPTPESRHVEAALRLESGWLHLHPEALEGLLYNRLLCSGVSPLEIEQITPGLRPSLRLKHPVNLGEGRVFRGHSRGVSGCAYSPEGSRILSASEDKTLCEWDRASGNLIRSFEGHSSTVSACAYSPDGSHVLSASWDYTLCEWDRASGNLVRSFEGHSNCVTACAYSPDGSRILSASWDNTIREWDRASGNLIRSFEGHTGSVDACAYSPDGSRILSASWDNTIREWDRASGNLIRSFEGHSSTVTACAYSPDGSRILSASWDNTVREWDRASGNLIRSFGDYSSPVAACAYSPDGSRILSAAYDATLREWDRASGNLIRSFEGHSDAVYACTYSRDGSRILSASHDNTLREWDRPFSDLVRTFERHSNVVCACAYSPEGSRVLSASEDNTLREWDRASGALIRFFEGHSDRVTACAYSPDGSRILSASEDNTLREWDRTSGDLIRFVDGHSDRVTACAYSPDGSRIVSASGDQTLREWDCASGELICSFEAHSSHVNACTYSPDGSRIVFASADQTLREWDCASGRLVRSFEGHTGPVTACDHSSDGSRILSASWDQTLREWDRASGDLIRSFEGHSAIVNACAYSPDGSHIASASWDSTVRIWRVRDGTCVDVLYGVARFRALAITRHGLAAGDDLGNVWILDCDWF